MLNRADNKEKSINSSHYQSLEVQKKSTYTPSNNMNIQQSTKRIPTSLSCPSLLSCSCDKFYIISYNYIAPFIIIATVSFIAYYFGIPFIFPSLGPTAFLHFAVPNKPAASPKNTLCGHFIGILAGSLALQVTGLYYDTRTLQSGVSMLRIFACALSVGLTCGFMILFKVPHPPSGATTLIVSLGILKTPLQLTFMMGAVAVITVEAFIVNRICRKDAIYPWWSAEVDNPPKKHPEIDDKTLWQNKMNNLNVDNFVDCFEICNELKDDGNMKKLIQFAVRNANLWKMKAFQNRIPFAMRVAIMNGK